MGACHQRRGTSGALKALDWRTTVAIFKDSENIATKSVKLVTDMKEQGLRSGARNRLPCSATIVLNLRSDTGPAPVKAANWKKKLRSLKTGKESKSDIKL